MRIAIFSDIHANLEAFEAVLGDLESQEYDQVICLGDWVGYGPNPRECIERGRAIPNMISMAGNHDWAALNKLNHHTFNVVARQAILWTKQQLGTDDIKFLESLSLTHTMNNILFVHSSPYNPSQWRYVITRQDAEIGFQQMPEGIHMSFIGHTHFSGIFSYGQNNVEYDDTSSEITLSSEKKYIINVGSVGQPRDKNPAACYGIYDTGTKRLVFRRVCYPLEAVQKKILKASLHPMLAARLGKGY